MNYLGVTAMWSSVITKEFLGGFCSGLGAMLPGMGVPELPILTPAENACMEYSDAFQTYPIACLGAVVPMMLISPLRSNG